MRDYLACEAELAKRQAKAKEKPTKANQALALDAEGDRNRLRGNRCVRTEMSNANGPHPAIRDDWHNEGD